MSIRPHYIYYPLYDDSAAQTVGEAIKKCETSIRENGRSASRIGIYKLIAVVNADLRIKIDPVDVE